MGLFIFCHGIPSICILCFCLLHSKSIAVAMTCVFSTTNNLLTVAIISVYIRIDYSLCLFWVDHASVFLLLPFPPYQPYCYLIPTYPRYMYVDSGVVCVFPEEWGGLLLCVVAVKVPAMPASFTYFSHHPTTTTTTLPWCGLPNLLFLACMSLPGY